MVVRGLKIQGKGVKLVRACISDKKYTPLK